MAGQKISNLARGRCRKEMVCCCTLAILGHLTRLVSLSYTLSVLTCGSVGQWLTLLPHSKSRVQTGPRLAVWSLRYLPLSVWVFPSVLCFQPSKTWTYFSQLNHQSVPLPKHWYRKNWRWSPGAALRRPILCRGWFKCRWYISLVHLCFELNIWTLICLLSDMQIVSFAHVSGSRSQDTLKQWQWN